MVLLFILDVLKNVVCTSFQFKILSKILLSGNEFKHKNGEKREALEADKMHFVSAQNAENCFLEFIFFLGETPLVAS